MTSYTVTGSAIYDYELTPCSTVVGVGLTSYGVTGLTLNEYEVVNCGSFFTANKYVVSAAITAHDKIGCPFTLGITPNCTLSIEDTDLVYSIWATNGQPLTLDNATVEWVAADSDGNPIITKTTDDGSIITFGNTLVVHLGSGEAFIPDEMLYYTATITTTETYTMTGTITVAFVQHVTIERLSATLQEPKPRMNGVVAQRMIALHGATPPIIRLEGITQELRMAGQRETQIPLHGTTRKVRLLSTPNVIRADCVFPQSPRMVGAIQEFKEN